MAITMGNTEVLSLKDVKNGKIGLIKLNNKYVWRYKNHKHKIIQEYSRKKFHSLKSFEKYVIILQEKMEKSEKKLNSKEPKNQFELRKELRGKLKQWK